MISAGSDSTGFATKRLPLSSRVLSSAIGSLVSVASYLKAIYDQSWRQSLDERMLPAPIELLKNKRHVWFHAASVGEVRGIAPLVTRLQKHYPDLPIVMTTTSTTGRATAKDVLPDISVRLAPLDAPLYIKRFLTSYRPVICIINETELWPNMLSECSRENIPICVVNGRISDRSLPRYKALKFFWQPLLGLISNIYAQSAVDRERFIAIGARPDQVEVVGSTKFDVESIASVEDKIQQMLSAFLSDLSAGIENPFIFTFGSVREEEEDTIVSSVKLLLVEFPSILFIVAPRHPSRFLPIFEKLKKSEIHVAKWSEKTADIALEAVGCRLILLDTLGDLGRAYSLSHAAFVGGTLVPIGGHNILEPAEYSKPVLTGPYRMNVRPAEEALRKEEALIEVCDAGDIVAAIKKLMEDSSYYDKMSEGAKRACEKSRGATSALMERITLLIR